MKYTIELTNAEREVICNVIRTIRDNSLGEHRLFENTEIFKFDEESTDYDAVYRKGLADGNKIADKDLKEIQESTYDVAYNEALKDADHAMDVLKSMTGTECAEWFEDCVGVDEVVCGFTVQRIVEITKAYEEKKKAEEVENYHILVDTLRTVTEEYPKETIVSALSEFGFEVDKLKGEE